MESAVQDQAAMADKTSTILTLIRRGDTVAHISSTLHVSSRFVEKVMEGYVNRMMA